MLWEGRRKEGTGEMVKKGEDEREREREECEGRWVGQSSYMYSCTL